MVERISGLSIDLSMDTAGFSRTMTDIKNSFRDLKRSARVNMNNIKFDSKDVNTYKKNLDELTKSYDNQKKNVNDLKKNYDMLVETQGKGSEEAQQARIEYNKQADELNKLGHALENAKDGMHEMYVESSKFKSIETGLENISAKMKTVGDGMVSIGKGMTASITAPVLGAITASVKSFADLEQAVGGVETLFKDSAGTVIKNSESAYKRAGISGVDYMENVTSFSATLLQGLEGDTEAAAKAADMAMVDMSDNANKFGTDIGSIQNAYQGFAKDNFAMLDNLKLGYGGSASEMARLINESGVLGDAMDVTAETVKDVPFDKMIEAIHEVQSEMGVTGTTVKEAEETISGSFGMMKASFQDLSAGFSQEGADIEGLLGNLKDSTEAFVTNVKKAIGKIWDNLPMAEWKKWVGAIGIAAGPILVVFGTIISTVGKVIGAFAPLFGWLAKMSGGFKTVYNGVKPFAVVFPKLAGLTKILGAAFTFLTGPVGLTIAAVSALGAGFVIAYNKSETFRNFVDGIKDKFTTAIEWIGQFKDGIIGLFKDDGAQGMDILTSIGISQEMADKLWEFTGYFIEFYWNVKEQIDKVKTAFKGIFDIFTGNAVSGMELLRSIGLSDETIVNVMTFVGKVKGAFFEMRYRIAEALLGVKDFFVQQFENIKSWWDSDGAMIFDAMGIVVKKVFDGIKFAVDFALKFVVELFNTFAPIVMGIWNVLWPTLQAVASTTWEKIKLVIGIAMDLIQGIISGISAVITGDWERFGEIISETASSIWTRVTEFFTNMKENTLTLFGELFSGAVQWFVNMYDNLKQRAEFIKTVVVYAFNQLKDQAIEKIVSLFNSVKQWFVNMYENLKARAEFIKTAVVYAFTTLKNETIKRIVEMYNSIKQWFFNLWANVTSKATQIKNDVVNRFTELKNNAIQRIKDMYNSIKQWFSNLFSSVSTTVTNLKNNVVNRFNDLKNSAIQKIKEAYNSITTWFSNMFSKVTSTVTNLKTNAVNRFNELKNSSVQKIREMYNSIKQWFANLWTAVKNTVTNLKNNVVNLFVNMKDGAINGVRSLYTGTKSLFNDIKNYAKDTFTNMVNGAKELPGKLGSAISNGASKAVDGVKSLGNKMVEKLGSVVNGVIDGLNSITSKIGISATIDRWNVPTFSTGTGSPSGKLTKNGKIAADTIAKVGDKGPGNGKGTRELVHYPNGKVGLYDNDATIFAPKGTTIFSNKETEAMLGQIPKFSTGTGSGLWGRIKEIAGKAVDYITNPKKIFDDLISAVGNKFGDLSGFAGTLIKGVWEKIKSGMLGWITDRFGEATVGKSQKWMNYRMTTPYSPNAPVPGYPTSFNGGRHYGIDYGTPTGVPITAPIAGTVTRMSDVGGGLVARLQLADKAVQYFMHMSSVKTGKVGVGESVGNSGNSGKWTTGPHVHWQHEDPSASYIQNRNTKNPLSTIKGHLKGGQILSDGLFNLHEGEYVINPNEPSEAMKLLAIVGKKLAGKSKQTREIASIPTGYGSSEKVVEILLEQNKLLVESNNKMNKAINVLLGIEDKTGFDPGKAKKSIDRHVDDRSLIY